MKFEHYLPTKIVYGRQTSYSIGEYVKHYGKRPLVVSGISSYEKSHFRKPIERSLTDNDLEFSTYFGVQPDPIAAQVNDIVDSIQSNNNDCLVAIGGGSVIDSVKAASVGLPFGKVNHLIGKNLSDDHITLPVIAVPTTFATGAEVTKGAIICDELTGFKSGIRGNSLFPKLALVDPCLTETLPLQIAIESGFDAFSHLLETAISTRKTRFSQLYSQSLLPKLVSNMRFIKSNGLTEEVIDDMSFAALLGGISVANCGTCLPHRLQQAIGSFPEIKINHPQGLAIVYSSWAKFVHPYVEEPLDSLCQLLGVSNFPDFIASFIHFLGLDYKLSDFGFTCADIPKILLSISGDVENDPIELDKEVVASKILNESL
ncbi:MAG: iron-containing alcohol dehydrogenase [Cellvibrionaceae bacterium]